MCGAGLSATHIDRQGCIGAEGCTPPLSHELEDGCIPCHGWDGLRAHGLCGWPPSHVPLISSEKPSKNQGILLQHVRQSPCRRALELHLLRLHDVCHFTKMTKTLLLRAQSSEVDPTQELPFTYGPVLRPATPPPPPMVWSR